MEYRLKYIFKNTRDKGHEVADCHGTFMSYEIVQEQEMSSPLEYLQEGFVFPELPETEYLTFNKDNSKMRNKAKTDIAHIDLPVLDNTNADTDDIERFPFTDAVWVEREVSQVEYDLENDKLPLVGTELVNFLNFDIDCFMNGGYRLLWETGEDGRGSHIIGWKKTEGFDLSKPWVRQTVNLYSIIGNSDSDDGLHDSIPFFIRMFGCSFINKEKWEYDLEEVKKIKDLQERLRVFCDKVFLPKDENDKRSNFERYCQEIKEISKKELRSFIAKDWFVPSSLEQALSRECYAMIKGNVNLFICENCGMYTVSDDKRSRLCKRLYYDGSMEDGSDRVLREYWYSCNEEKYIMNVSMQEKADIIERITQYERKRLWNHIKYHIRLEEIRNKLNGDFLDIIIKNEQKYKEMIDDKKTEKEKLQTANEYLDLIGSEMNKAIAARLGSDMKKDFEFFRIKNPSVKSFEGNIFE